jgi:hypothetical protein
VLLVIALSQLEIAIIRPEVLSARQVREVRLAQVAQVARGPVGRKVRLELQPLAGLFMPEELLGIIPEHQL